MVVLQKQETEGKQTDERGHCHDLTDAQYYKSLL